MLPYKLLVYFNIKSILRFISGKNECRENYLVMVIQYPIIDENENIQKLFLFYFSIEKLKNVIGINYCHTCSTYKKQCQVLHLCIIH